MVGFPIVTFNRTEISKKVKDLATNNVFIGTSSWKYSGWLGQLYSPDRYSYRGKVAKSRFEAGCLEEYAEVFKTVCVDAGFYRFPEEGYVEKLSNQVPDGFKLSFKVTDEITISPILPVNRAAVAMHSSCRLLIPLKSSRQRKQARTPLCMHVEIHRG